MRVLDAPGRTVLTGSADVMLEGVD